MHMDKKIIICIYGLKKPCRQSYAVNNIKQGRNLAFTHLYNYSTAAQTQASLVFLTSQTLKPEDASLQVEHEAELPIILEAAPWKDSKRVWKCSPNNCLL